MTITAALIRKMAEKGLTASDIAELCEMMEDEKPSPDIGVGRHVAWAVKPCCDGEIGADSKASGEVFKASPALGITQPREQAA